LKQVGLYRLFRLLDRFAIFSASAQVMVLRLGSPGNSCDLGSWNHSAKAANGMFYKPKES
jgi:hypothetical protein